MSNTILYAREHLQDAINRVFVAPGTMTQRLAKCADALHPVLALRLPPRCEESRKQVARIYDSIFRRGDGDAVRGLHQQRRLQRDLGAAIVELFRCVVTEEATMNARNGADSAGAAQQVAAAVSAL
jgi:hypothetical protein